jgi:hypothetical protein
MRRHAAAFYARATAAGHDLRPDQSLGWLTRYGHLQAEVRARLPRSVQHALDSVFAELGGDKRALGGKTRGVMTVDFLLRRRSKPPPRGRRQARPLRATLETRRVLSR